MMSSLFYMLFFKCWIPFNTFAHLACFEITFPDVFFSAASLLVDEKALEGNVILIKKNNKTHKSSTTASNYHIPVSNCLYFRVWMSSAINHSSSTLTDMAALPFDAVCASFEVWWMLVHSLSGRSSHFSSFLGFPGWLLTLSLFYLINGTISLVAVVIKSNEVSNGWGFVESAVGNWGGVSLRWGSVSVLCPYGNEIVFHFSLWWS